MQDRVRIIKYDAVTNSGSFEVHHPDGRQFVDWDDLPSHRIRPEILTREEALERARNFARDVRILFDGH